MMRDTPRFIYRVQVLCILNFTFCSILFSESFSGKVFLKNGKLYDGRIIVFNENVYIFKDRDIIKINADDIDSFKFYNLKKKNKRVIPKDYQKLIKDASKKYKLNYLLVTAVIKAESDFNEKCISIKGARGLMQLMPETAYALKVSEIYNPSENIDGGVRYLRYLIDLFKGDLTKAVAAYNAGPNAVKKYNGVPPYKETIDYVKKVKKYLKEYGHNKQIIKQKNVYNDLILSNTEEGETKD